MISLSLSLQSHANQQVSLGFLSLALSLYHTLDSPFSKGCLIAPLLCCRFLLFTLQLGLSCKFFHCFVLLRARLLPYHHLLAV